MIEWVKYSGMLLTAFSFLPLMADAQKDTITKLAESVDTSNIASTSIQSAFDADTVSFEDERFIPGSVSDAPGFIPGLYIERIVPNGLSRLSIRGKPAYFSNTNCNLGIYWNGIPITSANGNIDLTFFDQELITDLVFVSGPYSNGIGAGANIYLETRINKEEINSLEAGFAFGSNAMVDYGIKAVSAQDNAQMNICYVNRFSGGYRKQGYGRYRQLNLMSDIKIDSKRNFCILAHYYDGEYGLPGGLDSTQAYDSSWIDVPIAKTLKTHAEQSNLLLGISHKFKQNNRLEYIARVFLTTQKSVASLGESLYQNEFDKKNATGTGGSVGAKYTPIIAGHKSLFTINIEAQADVEKKFQYTNYYGEPKNLFDHYNNKPKRFSVFTQGAIPLPFRFCLTGGAGWHYVEYGHFDLFDTDSTDFTGIRIFRPLFSPEIKVRKYLGQLLVLYAKGSYGFNVPAQELIVTNNDVLVKDASPEKALNLEFGAKLIANKSIHAHICYYKSSLEGMIVNSSPVENYLVQLPTADVAYSGFESSLLWKLLQTENNGLLRFRASVNYNWNEFDRYVLQGKYYTGNIPAGYPRWKWTADVLARCPYGFRIDLKAAQIGEIALNDSNRSFSSPYSLISCNAGFEHFIGKSNLFIELYAGLENMFNTMYSLWYDINRNDAHYFYPYEGRVFFTGIGMKYLFKRS